MSTLTTTQLQQQYIAYFGRPGDPAGIKYWKTSGLTEKSFAEKIHAQDEYKNTTIASKSTEEQVNTLYTNLFGRSADAAGLIYWTAEIEAGRKALSSLALDLIWAASNPSSGNTTQGAADATALTNKVAAATSFTTDVEASTDAILAYQPETTGTSFKAGAAFDSAKTWLATITTTAATDAGIDTAVSNMTSANTTTTGTTTTLTDKVDTVSGGAYNDTFVGGNATLTTGDSLTGGSGIDTLRYTATGASAVTENGFTSSSVETIKIQSDATGGTTFTATGSTDVTKVVNILSTTDVTVDGLKALTTVELTDVQAGDTQIKFNDDLLTGSSDSVTLNLDGNVTTAGGSIGTITLGNNSGTGVETVDVKTSGAASEITTIAGGATTINVTGDQNLTISGALASVTKVDATNFTGNLSVVVDSDTTSKDVDVIGGSGDDTADFTDGFEASDTFSGGAGTDAIKLTQAVASGTINGTLTDVENLTVSDSGTGTIDMDSFSGISKVVYDAGITANGTAMVDDAVTGISVEVDAANATSADGSLTVDLKTDGSADEVTVVIDTIGAGEGIATLNAADAETLNISFDDDTSGATGTFTIATLVASDATKIVLSGDSEFTLTATTDPDTPILATLDAGAATDKLTLSGTNFVKTGATITLGSANDTLTFATADGADTIDLSKGGNDTLVYTAVGQSDTNRDIVKGFTSGSDDIDLTGLALSSGIAGVISSSQFAGVGASFSEAQGLLDGTKVAVFNSATNVLWVDFDEDSVLEGATDFQIKLDGVTSITAADLTLGSGVTATSKAAAFNTATKTDFTEGAKLTNEDDTLVTTVAHLVGSTVDGLGGDDTMNVTSATSANSLDISTGFAFADVETVTIGSNITTLTMSSADLTAANTNKVSGVSGTTQTLKIDASLDLKPITLRNIETLFEEAAAGSLYEFDTDNFTHITTLDLDVGIADTLEFAGGTYDLTSVTTSTTASSLIDLNTSDNLAKTLTIDGADFAGATASSGSIIGETTAGIITTINIKDGDDWSGGAPVVTNIDTVTITDASSTFTSINSDWVATNYTTVTGSSSADTTLIISGNATDLTNTTISNVATIGNETGLGGNAYTFDAASIDMTGVTALTWLGAAGDDMTFNGSYDATKWTVTSGDFNALLLAAGVDLTTDESFWAGAWDTVNGGATGTLTVNIGTAGGTLDFSGDAFGAISDLAASVVGTTGNDIIVAPDSKASGTTFTVATGTGNDTIRVENNSGNAFTSIDNTSTDTVVLADAIRVTDFNADNDKIEVDISDTVGTPLATFASVTSGGIDVTAAAGFAYINNQTLNDFTNVTGLMSAVGAVKAADQDNFFVAIANSDGSQIGVYTIESGTSKAGTNTPLVTNDEISLTALVDVTSGTIDAGCFGVY